MPLISIILPVYNGGEYLKDSVNSILAQSFTDFELLILDDCSTDTSWPYLKKLDDERIRVYQNDTNKGLFYNLNFLIQVSNSPLIKLWSQDDIMNNGCLQEIITFHEYNPQVGFSYCAVRYIDEESNNIIKPHRIDNTPSVISTDLHAKICFFTGSISANISATTLTKKALDSVGLFNEKMKMSGDFEMYVRVAQHFPVGFINKELVILRDHSNQLSRQEKYYVKALKEDIIAYQYLYSYSTDEIKKFGKEQLRNQKLVFYFTLMLKSLFKGNFNIAFQFWKAINSIDNGFVMLYYFLKNKLSSKNSYVVRNADNKWLMQ